MRKILLQTEEEDGVHQVRGGGELLPVGEVAPRPQRRREWSVGSIASLLDMAVARDVDGSWGRRGRALLSTRCYPIYTGLPEGTEKRREMVAARDGR